MSFDSLGIHIGIFYIRYYGLILMTAALIAAFVAEYLARQRHLDTEIVWDMFLWIVIAAIVGARIWHILTPPESMQQMNPPITTFWYLTHPFDAINLTKGGLGLPGALIGGALAMWIYVRRKKLSFGVWGDIAVPGIALRPRLRPPRKFRQPRAVRAALQPSVGDLHSARSAPPAICHGGQVSSPVLL